mmetsp:Transcript_25502/g.46304  ORF Transcript_25502/g.46304 Transcript_25502/m.46304 type:complete len:217 (+) Transcript_25502:566-1216(+)
MQDRSFHPIGDARPPVRDTMRSERPPSRAFTAADTPHRHHGPSSRHPGSGLPWGAGPLLPADLHRWPCRTGGPGGRPDPQRGQDGHVFALLGLPGWPHPLRRRPVGAAGWARRTGGHRADRVGGAGALRRCHGHDGLGLWRRRADAGLVAAGQPCLVPRQGGARWPGVLGGRSHPLGNDRGGAAPGACAGLGAAAAGPGWQERRRVTVASCRAAAG